MPNVFLLTHEQYEDLWLHLAGGDREEVAFVFAETSASNDGVTFRAVDLYLVPPEDLLTHQSFHISLTDEAQARIIKTAWDMRLALVELHSHLDFAFATRFSPSDMSGLEVFVPHVRWRLKGVPYLALVVGPREFDALVWRNGEPEPLDFLDVEDRILRPTGISAASLASARRYVDG